ncbi:hypothetical protein [Maridesulfovibrio sp.]|uniref:hypothetical protein n=1 Tax=unclassified Maridesulfovibrio TaxID=2794999 RepID=UPI003B00C3D4
MQIKKFALVTADKYIQEKNWPGVEEDQEKQKFDYEIRTCPEEKTVSIITEYTLTATTKVTNKT